MIAQQLVADLVAKADDDGFVWRSELARISEEDLDAVKVLAAAGAPSAEQFEAACDFLSPPPAPEDDSSRARGGVEPHLHLHLVQGLAPVARTSIGERFTWPVPEGLLVLPSGPFDRGPVVEAGEVTYEETAAALARFEKESELGSPIEAMWQVLKTDREEARRG
ncbi:hypothetical protein [Pseudoclavibacter sp. 8L]|uniref:hypothetical protein n=1 Tax=Pseudoclavibacter sp. 8L TaxID=2653162 RepID=UPI00135B0836|nr:hypothetical protein [Pseudoclavibacter sp. 8L]